MNTTLNTLIAQANERRQAGKHYSGSSAEIANVGKINCFRDYTIRKHGHPDHARTTWKLNGKTISAAALEAALS